MNRAADAPVPFELQPGLQSMAVLVAAITAEQQSDAVAAAHARAQLAAAQAAAAKAADVEAAPAAEGKPDGAAAMEVEEAAEAEEK